MNNFLKQPVRLNKYYLSLLKIVRTALGIKHKGFQEEREWRIAFIVHCFSDIYNYNEGYKNTIKSIIQRTYKDDINDYPSGEWVGDTTGDNQSYPEIGNFNFYATKSKLVPYFDFIYSPDSVKEIMVGPNCEISEHYLKCFLEHNGFNSKEITISKSQLTYRS